MITRVDFKVPNIVPSIADDKSNIKDFYCADVHGGRAFLRNDAGYPLNDIDMILRQQDAKVRESLLSQLEEVPTTGVPADTPNDEVLLGLRSRYQQTPSEMVSWYEKQLEIYENKIQVQQVEKAAEEVSSVGDVDKIVDNV